MKYASGWGKAQRAPEHELLANRWGTLRFAPGTHLTFLAVQYEVEPEKVIGCASRVYPVILSEAKNPSLRSGQASQAARLRWSTEILRFALEMTITQTEPDP